MFFVDNYCYTAIMIIGVDEVGRGSWAGPVCVAAVAWPDDAPAKGLADSKLLLAPKRVKMAHIIRRHAAAIGIGWVGPRDIDRIGLTRALQVAAQIAVRQINIAAPIIMDGREKFLGKIPAQYIVKADGKIPAVMAASIVAKVARDTYMHAISPQFAQYRFDKHVGYGTPEHRRLIAQFGVCVHHRLSWKPLKQYAQ